MSDLKEKLAQASKKAETQKAERRARVVKGSHLVETMRNLAQEAGLNIRENTGFYVISGKAGKNYRIAIAKRGGVVDLLSFTVSSAAVRQVTEEEAKAKHLGRVKGRIAFDGTDEETLAAYREALEFVSVEQPEPPKAPRAPRTPRVPKAPAAEVTTAPVTA